MPINIREILYPGDSDQIKWDKINYNFDQVVTNGGKTGPSGAKGDVGPAGITGNTGAKGDTGDKGTKGEIGNTTNFWDQLNHGNSDTFVLKPIDGSTGNETALFIGDTSYTSGVNVGDLSQFAQLAVKNSPGFSYAQAFFPADDAASSPSAGEDALTISGNYSADWDGTGVGSGTVWNIVPEFSGINTNRRLNIAADMLDLTGDLLKITGGTRGITVSAGSGGLSVNAVTDINGPTDINNTLSVVGATTLQNTLVVQGNNSSFTGTGSILIPKGTTANRPATPNSGMIRFNTQSQKFEGYGGAGSWLDFNRLSNASKNTYVAVEADPDYPLGLANQVRFAAGGSVIANMSSTGFYIDKDVYINNGTAGNSNDLYFRGPASGIVYPAGALQPSSGDQLAGSIYYSSPSNGSAESLRNLNDYFYQESYVPKSNISGRHDGYYLVGYSTMNATTGNPGAVSWLDPTPSLGSSGYSIETSTKVSWTKIGNQVFVNGYYELSLNQPSNPLNLPQLRWTGLTPSSTRAMILGLGETTGTSALKAQFPFKNDSSMDIIVNIQIFDVFYKNVAAAGSTEIFGIIKPGRRDIIIYSKETYGVTIASDRLEVVAGKYLDPAKIERNSNATTKIAFSFTMPTTINTGKNSYPSGITLGGGGLAL